MSIERQDLYKTSDLTPDFLDHQKKQLAGLQDAVLGIQVVDFPEDDQAYIPEDLLIPHGEYTGFVPASQHYS